LKDQEALVGISKNSKRIIAKTKGHNIQFNEPNLIVDAVRDTVESFRTRHASNPWVVRESKLTLFQALVITHNISDLC